MEVQLDKRYPVAATLDQAWAVLSDLRATAACMPGAEITAQLDERNYQGQVRSRVGPATMNFAGTLELQGLDAQLRELRLQGKGADRGGSSATMILLARLEASDEAISAGQCLLVGQATVTVSGKLAQFGSRLLVPVSDALLQQFAANFVAAAQAVAVTGIQQTSAAEPNGEASGGEPRAQPDAPTPASATPARELNALALLWAALRNWLANWRAKP
ncbi:CoxG family protein [Inhella sp.]|uniref:CoxG family protein n=1 Tax=Inhella sp. TaxID=1921806 RepID=UPI0035B127C0